MCAISLLSCSERKYATIRNDSGNAMSNIVLSGSGFSERIGALFPGAQYSFAPHPHGESGLRVEFDAAGQHYDSGEEGYFESSDYDVSVVVEPNMKISVDTALRHRPY